MMKNWTGFFWYGPADKSRMNDRCIAFLKALAKEGAALVSSAVKTTVS
jgi:hypothetical protein